MDIARREALPAYITRDGSEIREWVCSCVPPYSPEDTVLV